VVGWLLVAFGASLLLVVDSEAIAAPPRNRDSLNRGLGWISRSVCFGLFLLAAPALEGIGFFGLVMRKEVGWGIGTGCDCDEPVL
jgi:hypothetical protein